MYIYVASSWRNETRQQEVVQLLRTAGYGVYDFRNPAPGNRGFSWSAVNPDREWLKCPERFRRGLQHPIAQRGFALDMGALQRADACVLVMPCGRSAHLELGYAVGAGKRTYVLLDDPLSEPELMWLMCDGICTSAHEVLSALSNG